MKLSFRNRIALFTATAAAAIIGLVFLLVYSVVYLTAYRHLDQDILQEKEEVMNNLHWTRDSLIIYAMPEWEEKEHKQIEVNPTFLQVVDAHGRVLFRSQNLQKDILLIDPQLAKERFFNSRISDQRIRQGQFPIQNETGQLLGHLSVGISQEESAIVLHNLRNTLWITFPILLLVLFLATALAASKGIAPVLELNKAAAEISEHNIQDRLPLPEKEDEIRQLAFTINALLDRIESGIRREKQFTADASHEIRTPLTAIRGTLEVLLRKQREPAQYAEKINRVILEVDRLNVMLDQLLQLARLESGGFRLHPNQVDLSAFCQSLLERWHTRLGDENMRLELKIPPKALVYADDNLLSIILDNLLSNAVKYGKAGGQMIIAWNPETKSLSVRDDGPGIGAAQLPHIFDRFYRADQSRSAKVSGAGLGLSIAKKLADLMGLDLRAASVAGEGALFLLKFP